MWNANLALMQQGCEAFGVTPENTAAQIQDIYNSIQQVAESSLVDHRLILAIIMQEVRPSHSLPPIPLPLFPLHRLNIPFFDLKLTASFCFPQSNGCLQVPTSNNGVANPGLMQSFQGSTFVGNQASASAQAASITQMITDGTQGTAPNNGLVVGINTFGDIFSVSFLRFSLVCGKLGWRLMVVGCEDV